MELLEKIKLRLGIEDTNRDEQIKAYIQDITDKIKSICKRCDFPKQLEYLVIRYAMNCYLYYKDKDNNSNEQLQVSSASDNGQSVNFKTVEIVSKDDVDLDKFITKNMAEISNYAYMGW